LVLAVVVALEINQELQIVEIMELLHILVPDQFRQE
jgi:hypothetical protein